MAKNAEKENKTAEDDQKKSRNRSPNYPLFNLEDALNKARQLHEDYGVHSIAVNLAHKKWGYAEHGSVGNQCIAALKAYGLLSIDGKGKSRKVQLTDSVDRIIRDAPDRSSLLERSARAPTIHAEILEEYSGKGLPPDDVLKQYLVWERDGGRFNEDVVDSFIERLRETLEFSGLDIDQESGGGLEVDTSNNGNGPKTPSTKVQVGSLVQWTSKGVNQFSKPHVVVSTFDDDWAFVEGSPTGIPMSELSVVDQPETVTTPAAPPINPFYTPPKPVDELPKDGMASDRTTLDEGAVRLDWPDSLSEDSVEEFQDWMIGRINRARRKAGLQKIKIDEA